MPKLIVCRDGRDYRIEEFSGTLTIGRDQENTIVLDSPQVSRHHATVTEQSAGHYHLVDRDSTNGVWIGREKVTAVRLRNGLSFRIVDYFFTFVDEEQEIKVARVFGDSIAGRDGMDGQTILFGLDDVALSSRGGAAAVEAGTDDQQVMLPLFEQLGELEDAGALIAALLRHGMELLGGGRGFVALLDDDHQLVYREIHGFDPLQRQQVRDDIIRQVMDQGQAITVRGQAGQTETQEIDAAGAGDIVCVPLFFRERTNGCLYCQSDADRSFFAQGCRLLQILAMYVCILVDNCLLRSRVALEQQGLQTRLANRENTIIHSPAMLKLYRDIKTIAPINVPVLVLGEAGTGKELVAAALHSFSGRQGAYVTLNCSAIPEGIFESELFGSVRGAFHNAVDKPGKLEQAHGGTLFLDEIGDMALPLQPKLLRFLENNEVTRLGDTRLRRLDVRMVAATNQDLEAMIRERKFRDDFFQRLSCFVLKVPPLRERREDIEPLVRHFLQKFADEYTWPEPAIGQQAMLALVDYSWPGNIRQLRNVILRLSVQCRGRRITVHDLSDISGEFDNLKQQRVDSFPSLEEMEKDHIRAAMARAGGNISDAARMIGIARSTLYQKMKKYGIRADG